MKTNGQLAYVSTISFGLRTVNADGTLDADVPGLPSRSFDPAWSPSGLRLAFASLASGKPQIWLADASGANVSQLTHDPVAATDPTWSPDGGTIAFTSVRDGTPQIYAIGIDGKGERRLTTDPAADQQADWAPTGDAIAFESNRSGSFDIWLMAPDGSNQRPLMSAQPAPDTDPDWSPDGGRVAFARSLRGVGVIFSVRRDGSGLTQLTSGNVPDGFPVWSPDGRQIAYTDGVQGTSSTISVMSASGDTTGYDSRQVAPVGRDADWGPLPPPTQSAAVLASTAAANAEVVAGDVSVTPPEGTIATPLVSDARIPMGATVNTVEGAVQLQASSVQKATVSQGAFLLGSSSGPSGARIVTLRLRGAHRKACPRAPAQAARLPDYPWRLRVRSHGHVGMRTGDIKASSRGTDWLTVETCRGTLTRVRQGVVSVVDLARHRTIRVRAGHEYFARRVSG